MVEEPHTQPGVSTPDEEIRENQRKNRLQRERERAALNNNSTSSNGQDTQDKDKA